VTPERATLARHRLTLARESLAEGDHLLASDLLRGALNRYYYAAFYAARGLLSIRAKDSARHSGVIALFQREFVAPGHFDVDIGAALPRAFAYRVKSDYADYTTVTRELAAQVGREAHGFVEECARVLERLIAYSSAGET
jgi:uncharacterized protein (UPF0332 family)